MEAEAIATIERYGIMALATNRPDGWPQATTVGFVNDGLILYILISRTSQKFANIQADNRISACMAVEPGSPQKIKGISLAGHAGESRDEPYRSQMLARLQKRHPGYYEGHSLDITASALIRVTPTLMSLIDYSQALGHDDLITVGVGQLTDMTAARPDNSGLNPALASE